jgi:PAS domain S-box-containing protein
MLSRSATKRKLASVGVCLILLPLIAGLLLVYVQSRRLADEAAEATSSLSNQDIDHIVEGVYALCDAQQENVWTTLQVAHQVFLRAGTPHFLPEKVSWNATNQFTKQVQSVELPKMAVGGKWLGQNSDMATPSPIVDEVRSAVGCTSTVFQRLNERGDMLRVCTNVEGTDGKRAVGTYIPAVNPDGSPNPVVSCVMRGETYTGRAFVVKAWYITSYEPIYDEQQQVVGMLYVGVPESSLTTIRDRVRNIHVAGSGRAFVLDTRGTYVFSGDEALEGTSILDARDAAGAPYVREILRIASALQPGQVGHYEYTLQAAGDPSAGHRICRFTYLKKCDWVIAAEVDEVHLQATTNRIRAIGDNCSLALGGMAGLSLLGTLLVWYFTSRLAHNELEAVIESLPDPFMVVAPDYRIVLANKATREAAGKDPVLHGLRCHQVSHRRDTPCEGDHDPCPLRQVLATRQTARVTHTHPTQSGEPRYVDIVASPILDRKGNVLHIIETCRDVTDRTLAEEGLHRSKLALEDSNRRLEHAIEHANEMAAQAGKASAAKGEFLANMSHEIRTPLTAILGFAELLSDAPMDELQRQEALQSILRNGRHLLDVINDILDISKIEAGKLTLEPRPCSLPSLIADVLSMMRIKAIERHISLTAEYATELPETILADEARLRQPSVHLVGNAIKFTETGGVRVVTALVPSWRHEQPAVRIDVIDTGIGIRPKHLAILCAPFTQADSSTSRKYGGTGLGLAITRRLVEIMGGEILIHSTPGSGSTFSILIPTGSLEGVKMLQALDETVLHRPASPRPEQEGRPLEGIRVLLAEDGQDNRALISAIMRLAGAAVSTAENGRIAVEKALREPFDLILMDVQMPEMDGYQATKLLREKGFAQPIIALTAHATLAHLEQCKAAGCSDFLTKPVDRSLLIDTIACCSAGTAGREAMKEARAEPPSAAPGNGDAIRSTFADDHDLAEVLDNFVASLPELVDALQRELDDGCHPELQRLAHQLKGAGGGYGYPMLTEMAGGLEQLAKAGEQDRARAAIGEIRAACRRILCGHRSNKAPVGA